MSDTTDSNRLIYLAGGCFWGMQGYLEKLPGIVST